MKNMTAPEKERYDAQEKYDDSDMKKNMQAQYGKGRRKVYLLPFASKQGRL